ncbi:hypothetical protein EWM64_g8934 [Hericium alpestre]|uniref:Uncharacterized protein n=1 Tax=Hericium alpestre TaxID=135208 RepID=A0A4Y9ZLF0_9AGAM|nr:hypothetical protein EWM64_g8934 [Hericium alpestre]
MVFASGADAGPSACKASHAPRRAPDLQSMVLPINALELLQSLDSTPHTLALVEQVYDDISPDYWVNALMEIGFNRGTAVALASVMGAK